ncbi:outer membrane protein OmpA-like peptidoglycan-associated protein [Paraburkholderia terricola]|uniref:OmpA family protein n=1 Tax=Paraburkholderia terricola TaxID=169427 RepID=UPI002862EF1A|nr:OmpA family protein [Paraburkholderia terricola]MDR6446535.1 outer membrane protein OmpA-like peptidoglycan-associated protein [Paraburkholderia terricola]
MKSINLAQSISLAFTEAVRQQLSRQIGLSPELIERVVAHAAPVLIAALMAGATTPEGAATEFSTLRSAESNARIAEELAHIVTTVAGIKDLEASGDSLIARATGRRIAVLSDQIAGQAGVPPQASHVLSGMVGAVLFGMLKHHVLIEQGEVEQLPALLDAQLPAIAGYVTDGVARSLGFDHAANFNDSISARLDALTSRAVPQAPTLTNGAAVDAMIATPPAVAASTPRRQSSPKWVWPLFATLALVLAAVFAYVQLHPTQADAAAAASSERPVAERTRAASGVAPEPAASPSAALSAVAAAVSPVSSVSTAAASATSAAVVSSDAIAAASSPVVSAATTNSQLAFRVDRTGVPQLMAVVGSDAEKQQLVDALTRKFGAGRFTSDVTVEARTAPAEWLGHMDDLLLLMTLPRAEARIDGRRMELGGAATSEALGWRERLQREFGSSWDIAAFNADRTVLAATDAFLRAMTRLTDAGSPCTATEVAKVLNLQVVNFAKSSGHVPSSARENLSVTAQLMKACANRAQPMRFDIAVFSDNVGEPRANLQLSQKRADAVRTFLVDAGAPANLLDAKGCGAARPVTSNLVASGRFANRRVEFVPAAS